MAATHGEEKSGLPLTPMLRFSPWSNGRSTLYDSYEFMAINHHLKRTLQAATRLSPRRLSAPAASNTAEPKAAGGKRGRGFMPRLWKKFKEGILKRQEQNAAN